MDYFSVLQKRPVVEGPVSALERRLVAQQQLLARRDVPRGAVAGEVAVAVVLLDVPFPLVSSGQTDEREREEGRDGSYLDVPALNGSRAVEIPADCEGGVHLESVEGEQLRA